MLDAGRTVHARLSTVAGHLDKLGRTLNTAVGAYNATVGSLERSLLPSARRMADLGVSEDQVEPPRAVDDVARPITAPTLVEELHGSERVTVLPQAATGEAQGVTPYDSQNDTAAVATTFAGVAPTSPSAINARASAGASSVPSSCSSGHAWPASIAAVSGGSPGSCCCAAEATQSAS